jgi:putative transcriptional regulator
VLTDIFLVPNQEGLESTFAAAPDADSVHVYLGYSGWTAPQLEQELSMGAWYIFQGSAKTVFESDPEAMWERLIRETEMRIASLRPRAAGGDLLPRD